MEARPPPWGAGRLLVVQGGWVEGAPFEGADGQRPARSEGSAEGPGQVYITCDVKGACAPSLRDVRGPVRIMGPLCALPLGAPALGAGAALRPFT